MKPIFITDEEKETLIKEFSEQINTSMYNGVYSFSRTFTYNEKDHAKAKVIYTANAYVKMLTLLGKFNTEVAWHILVKRGEMDNEFIVYDVLVYPQKVTGSTVNTDDQPYTQFMIDLTDDQAENLRGQCHSHVNMNVTPSSVDTTHQEKLLKMLNDEGFYLFQIWNKKLEVNSYLYDYENNILYEPKDVEVEIMDQNEFMMTDFYLEAKDIVKDAYSAAQTPSYGNYSGYSDKHQEKTKNCNKKKKESPSYPKKWSDSKEIEEYPDYDDYSTIIDAYRNVYNSYYDY